MRDRKILDVEEGTAEESVWHLILEEVQLIANLALPTVVVQFALYFIFPQTASRIGLTLGSEELAGFSLACLTGSLTCLSVVLGILSAADTLMPRAFGARDYSQIGILAVRSVLIIGLALFVPTVVILTCMENLFILLGQDPIASALATKWLQIFVAGVPFVVLFRVLQRFLASQNTVSPLLLGSVVGCFFVHPILLYYLVPPFEGSSFAVVLTQMIQSLLALIWTWLNPSLYHSESWNGITTSTIKEAIDIDAVRSFTNLSLGGMMSMSEWWFWEVVCFLVGHLGVKSLCVHTIAYNLMPLSFMIPLGLSIGLSVRMGHLLSQGYVAKAKWLAAGVMALGAVAGILLALLFHCYRDRIIDLFTNDKDIVEGCREIWPSMCVYVVMLFVYGVNGGILRGLGKQWTMGVILCAVLWVLALPTIVRFAILGPGGVKMLWRILPWFYFSMNVMLSLAYITADWNIIGRAKRRSEATTTPAGSATETSCLIAKPP